MVEPKKTRAAVPAAAAADTSTVGETLRRARQSRHLEISDVAAAIRIRAVQLQAIEDNNIEALPGMTYAVGFVRNYANHLGLNGAEVANRFKAEQGAQRGPSRLIFPEPELESRAPDPVMVGVGICLAIVVLVLWSVFSDGAGKTAEKVPPSPATSVAETTAPPPAAAQLAPPPETPLTPAPGEARIPPLEPMPLKTLPASAAPPAAAAVAPAPAIVAPAPAVPPPAATSAKKPPSPPPAADAEDEAASVAKPAARPAEEASEPITIKREKGRIVLRAAQDSWVQVSDTRQNVIFRKVLREGDSYTVPDQTGLSLVTSNAGGLEIVVDGQKVQPIGNPGEIVRGVALDPAELKKKKTRMR